MKNTSKSMQRGRFLALTGALSVLVLSGCGAVNSAINSVIPEVNNMANLNGQIVETVIGSGRATISGSVSATANFNDQTLEQVSKLNALILKQSLSDATVTMPGSAAAPTTFSLRNITLKVTLSDGEGARSVDASATVAGPVTFTRQGSTNTYVPTAKVEISNIKFSGETFSTVIGIVTGAPSPNTATGKLSLDADDTELPAGTKISFTLVDGKAKPQI